MDPQLLSTFSLRSHPHGQTVQRILAAALQAVDPAAAVKRFLRRSGSQLTLGEQTYDLNRTNHIWVVGAGKAGAPMCQAVVDVLGDRITGGLVIVKEGHAPARQLPPALQIIEASHPVPDSRGVQAAHQMIELLSAAGPDDLVLCLISGGGSALMSAPAQGIGLDDLQQLTHLLLACGANINEINTLRKHLDEIKGGGLARCAAPARTAALILSDVIGDPLEVIASGPTAPDPSTFADAVHILNRYGLWIQTPAAIRDRLERGLQGRVAETPKPGDGLFERVQNQVISSNIQAARAGLNQAECEGLHPLLLTTFLQGEARQAGRMLAAVARQAAASGDPLPRPCCIAAGGETTVTLLGSGRGGRNQELALGAVTELGGLPDVLLAALATDGGDGPTDAAGAVVTGETLLRAHQAHLDPLDSLSRNDSYPFFDALGDLLKPGPTLTNVNDLTFLFLF